MQPNFDKDIEMMIKSKVSKDVDQASLGNAFDTIDDIQDGILQVIGILEESTDKCPQALRHIDSAFTDAGVSMMRADFIPIYEKMVGALSNLKDIRDDVYNFTGDYRDTY